MGEANPMTPGADEQMDAECWVCKTRLNYATTEMRTANGKIAHANTAHCIAVLMTQLATVTAERDAQKWRAENFHGCFLQQEERAKSAERRLADAVKAEREECAKIAEKETLPPNWDGSNIAALIRQRGGV